MTDSKINEVLRKLHFLIQISTAMQTSINNFNENISDVENKITDLESKVEEIKAMKTYYDTLSDHEAKTNAALNTVKTDAMI